MVKKKKLDTEQECNNNNNDHNKTIINQINMTSATRTAKKPEHSTTVLDV